MGERQRYSREFKMDAVRMLEAGQKPAADLARELGVARNKLYRWQKEIAKHGPEVFPGTGRRSAKEVDELRREKKEKGVTSINGMGTSTRFIEAFRGPSDYLPLIEWY